MFLTGFTVTLRAIYPWTVDVNDYLHRAVEMRYRRRVRLLEG